MSASNAKKDRDLGATIRRELGSAANMRFLNGLSTFKADHRMPDLFRELLADLDRAEIAKGTQRS